MKKRPRTFRPLFATLWVAALFSSCVSLRDSDVLALYNARAAAASLADEGWSALLADRFADSRTFFTRALEADPRDGRALSGSGLALMATGHYAEAAEKLAAAISTDPADPRSVVLLDLCRAFLPASKSGRALVAEASRTLERGGGAEWIRREGTSYFRDDALSGSLDGKSATEAARRLGAVGGWSVVGPFPDHSGSGFLTPYVGEGTDTPARLVGVDGATLSWVGPVPDRADLYAIPSRLLGSEEGYAFYARAAVQTPASGAYRFIMDRMGSFRVWVDGNLLAEDPTRRAGDEMVLGVLSLDQGPHQVLVKTCGPSAGFSLFVVPEGTEGAWPTAGTGAFSSLIPDVPLMRNDPLLALTAARADEGGGAEAVFWLAHALLGKGCPEEGLAALRLLPMDRGGRPSALMAWTEAALYRDMGYASRSRNAVAATLDPDHPFAPAYALRMAEAARDQRTAELQDLIASSRSAFGDWLYADLYDIVAATSLGDVRLVTSRTKTFRDRYPDSAELDLVIATESLGGGTWTLAETGKTLAEKGYTQQGLTLRMRGQFREGRMADAGAAAALLYAAVPSAENAFISVAAPYYAGTLAYSAMQQLVQDRLAVFPRSTDLLSFAIDQAERIITVATVLLAAKPDATIEQAIKDEQKRLLALLPRYLALRPDHYARRERYRSLVDCASMDSLLAPTRVEAAISAYEAKPAGYADDAVIVIDEQTDMYFGDGAVRSERLLIYRPLSARGIRDLGQFDVERRWSSETTDIVEAYVRTSDGSVVQALRSGLRLTFPGLDRGDYVVVRYRRGGLNRGALARDYWSHVTFTGRYPVALKRFSLIAPMESDVTEALHNDPTMVVTRTTGTLSSGHRPGEPDGIPNMIRTSWTARDLPAARIGIGGTAWQDSLMWLDLSTVKDWSRIVSWYADLSGGRAVPDSVVRALARELTSGIGSDEETVKALYDFVSFDVEYEDLDFQYSAYIPQEAGSVLEDGYGDCKDKATLLMAMLDAVGIDSWIALTTPNYRAEASFLPSNRFSHAVLCVPLGGQVRYLDPTSELYSYPDVPAYLQRSWVLDVEAGAESPFHRVETQNVSGTHHLLVVDPGDPAAVECMSVYTGAHAAAVRATLLSDRSEIDSLSLAAFLGLEGLTIRTVEEHNISGLERDPVVSWKGSLPSLLSVEGDRTNLSLPWMGGVPPSLAVRARGGQAVEIDDALLASAWKQTIVLRLPTGYQPLSAPANAEYRLGEAYARYSFRGSGSLLICEREIHVPVILVAADAAPQLAAFVEQCNAKERERVVLALSPRAARK